MKQEAKKIFLRAGILFLLFVVFTILIQYVDVRTWETGTSIGFSTLNIAIFKLFGGYHELLYIITDLCAYPAIALAMVFAVLGVYEGIQRKSIFKVDPDLFVLGSFYVAVVAAYLVFEVVIINYRPILVDGVIKASYPSSHTLISIAIFATAVLQMKERLKNQTLGLALRFLIDVFTTFTIAGRLICGAHWLTDILGALLLSSTLVECYKACICLLPKKEKSDGPESLSNGKP